jgi:type 1 fimbriae regulatory protein FimE
MRNKALPVKRKQTPTAVNGTTTPPRRVRNADVRPREYLTAEEIARLVRVAGKGKESGQRDATMITLAFRHGLRVSELVAVRWDQLDFKRGTFHVVRRKNGRPSVHLLRGTELRMLRKLQRDQRPPSPYVFTTKRKTPITAAAFRKQFARIGQAAEFPFPVHPHMLRHACGFKLANDGEDTRALQEWLGHSNIMHTVRYTELTPKRFKNFFADDD